MRERREEERKIVREGEVISPSRDEERKERGREEKEKERKEGRGEKEKSAEEGERERERNKEKFHFIIKQNYILDKSKSLNVHKMLLNYEKSRISFKT